jgi:hypothetical protein
MVWVAPLFIENSQTSSLITMVNTLPAAIDFDVILSDLDGNELARKTTTVPADAALQIKVRDLLDSASRFGPAYGSAVLTSHRMASLAAQLSIMRRNANGVLDDVEEEFAMLMEERQPAEFRSVASGVTAAPIVAVRSLAATERTVLEISAARAAAAQMRALAAHALMERVAGPPQMSQILRCSGGLALEENSIHCGALLGGGAGNGEP